MSDSAIEWLNETFCRSVTVTLDVSVPLIKISKRRGGTLRRLDLSQTHVVTITVTKKASRPVHGPFVCISVPKNYDVVLRLQNETHWTQLKTAIISCLKKHNKTLCEIEAENDVLLEEAETKDKRQEKLDHFFREAYSKAFKEPKLSDNTKQFEDVPTEEIMQMKLTKSEFADAMGMRENDLFVERMFACMAKSDSSVVCFQEFIEVLKRFTQAGQKEKLQLVFEMCDRDGNGQVERREFCDFIKSLNMAVGVKIDQYEQDDVIDSILRGAKIAPEQETLSYEDFEKIFSVISNTRRPLGIHLRKAQLKVNLEE